MSISIKGVYDAAIPMMVTACWWIGFGRKVSVKKLLNGTNGTEI